LNLGCGPAREIQEFLAEEEVSNHAHFTLLDFNDETLRHAAQVLEDQRRRHARRTSIVLQRKSVQHVLREAHRPVAPDSRARYDLIYCAGLFDYLSDRVCRQLMTIFHEWLAPGGLLAATNVDDRQPFRHMLEFVLDWHLIYRTAAQGASLLPPQVQAGARPPHSDPTAVNVFIEARKD
jgi:extracellular factor (EF) 3-hydroxypalmitic acid methyl ester biosynthesis protein